MDKHIENFNKELEHKKIQTELKNAITEIKYILEGINSRLDDMCLNDLTGRKVEAEKKKEKQ